MRRFELTETVCGKKILVQILALPSGIHIGIYGGDLPHIGAVSIVDPDGMCSTTRFPGHKDDIISTRWAEALAGRGLCPAVVVAGIHYDGISSESIAEVLEWSEAMLEKTLEELTSKVQNSES